MPALSVLSERRFHDEEEAYAYVEARIWPDGPICPHCGETERVYRIKANPAKKVRLGLHACGACRKQFTVRVGTIFESSHLPLHKWLQAMHLMCCSKKGISANQLHRILNVTLKTAWFLAHRIREAMKAGDPLAPLGGKGKAVEADETFIGRKEGAEKKRGYGHKHAVLSLIERGGEVRSQHVRAVNAETLKPILRAQIEAESWLMTDEARYYEGVGKEFAQHFAVNHGVGEYVRGGAHTNTLENYFSIFKRGMKGVYQHCSERHLKRYLAAFDLRYNNRLALGVGDSERAERALLGAKGRRLTYRGPD